MNHLTMFFTFLTLISMMISGKSHKQVVKQVAMTMGISQPLGSKFFQWSTIIFQVLPTYRFHRSRLHDLQNSSIMHIAVKFYTQLLTTYVLIETCVFLSIVILSFDILTSFKLHHHKVYVLELKHVFMKLINDSTTS